MSLVSEQSLVAQPRDWFMHCFQLKGMRLEPDLAQVGYSKYLASSEFALEAERLATFTLAGEFGGRASYYFGITAVEHGRWVHTRLFQEAEGKTRFSIAFRPERSGRFRLLLALEDESWLSPPFIDELNLVVQTVRAAPADPTREAADESRGGEGEADLHLPHWGPIRRSIHRRCRRSRSFNNVVAAIEMRLGRTEILSLPQYMALCPTGQCNALCGFCSVTINRSGITKKQLPFDRLNSFLGPVSNAIQMYGIEGNGEPTLYARFPELLDTLTKGGAKAYLITNGSRLQEADIPLLMALDSVNFSLNAASAETHRATMKLKNFDDVTRAIKALVRERGIPSVGSLPTPQVSVSYVVTNDNAHETSDFLRFAEQELGVDIVIVRPLSELGNEIGSVEDLRDLVPYESDIRDVIEAVTEYMSAAPRRAEIRIAPETFRSYRADPVGRVVMPKGFEGKLLPPRRTAWVIGHDVDAHWQTNSLRLRFPAGGELACSGPVDVEPFRTLAFTAKVAVVGGPVSLKLQNDSGLAVGSASIADNGGVAVPVELSIDTKDGSPLSFVVEAVGGPGIVQIEFERMRTPAPFVASAFHVPRAGRWEVCLPNATVEWAGRRVSINSPNGGGPYILKSYGIPCPRNTRIELAVRTEVRRGSLTVAVLDAEGLNFLETFHFQVGVARGVVFFDTAENEAVRIVVAADPALPLEATVEWAESGAIEAVPSHRDGRVRVPTASQWTQVDAGMRVVRTGESVSLAWSGRGSPYLLESARISIPAGHILTASLALDLRTGRLGFGALSADRGSWLAHRILDAGQHRAELRFDTGSSACASFVLFAVDGTPVEAVAHFDEMPQVVPALPLEPVRQEPESLTLLSQQGVRSEPAEDGAARPARGAGAGSDDVAPARGERGGAPRPRLFGRWRLGSRSPTARRGPVRIYCQKPWTDLHNFTVDGRMDVCCIATGPSQERYQLGNLTKQSFQEIWNGPTAQEFRRTVNSRNPLPPCMRCPMAYAYQGLWFDPAYTADRVATTLRQWLKSKPVLKPVAPAVLRAAHFLVKQAFRGFSVESRWAVRVSAAEIQDPGPGSVSGPVRASTGDPNPAAVG